MISHNLIQNCTKPKITVNCYSDSSMEGGSPDSAVTAAGPSNEESSEHWQSPQ